MQRSRERMPGTLWVGVVLISWLPAGAFLFPKFRNQSQQEAHDKSLYERGMAALDKGD